MTRLSNLSRRELEKLSAYLDGQLSAKDEKQLEARLQSDPSLRKSLDELRGTVQLVRQLPALKPPRSFKLTPEMVGLHRPKATPWLQWATALASLAFAVVVGLDALGGLGGATFGPAASEPMALQEVASNGEAGLAARQVPAEEAPLAEEVAEEVAAEPEAMTDMEVAPALESRDQTQQAEGALAADKLGAAEPMATLGEGAELYYYAPGARGTATPLPAATTTPTPEPAPTSPAPPAPATRRVLSPVRVAEIALGGLVIVLAGLTYWVRRRS